MAEDFPGGGETGALLRSFDWSTTPLGPRERWPMSLKSIVRTMLHARQPMIVWWGPELTQIYNDAMLDSMRDKHPRGMGEPAREAWREAWKAVGHELQRVVDHGDAIWNEDIYVPVDRNARIEDAYWTYSYSPVFDDDGSRAGMLIICTETTAGVVARQQLEQAKREADAAREELRAAFLQASTPIAILLGERLVFALANAAYERLVGREVVGKSLEEAFSEQEVASYRPLIEGVFRTGEALDIKAAELRLADAAGHTSLHYIDVAYHPYRNADQQTIGVVALINDVTAAVTARKNAERQEQERAAMLEREQELRLAAEAGERARDEFLAMLGHELRNPLAPIVTATEMMALRGDQYPRERSIIARQAEHLTHLLDDLLDVARVTRGKLELRRAPIDIEDVIDKAVEQVEPQLRSHPHSLVRVRGQAPLAVDGDAVRLAQVLVNLLTNAVRYTPTGSTIEITAALERHEVVVVVADDGPGLDPALIPRIFDLFVQGERRIDRSEGGLGLGLALVKQLVTRHAGTVSARNRPRGGSEFTVRLPAIDPARLVAASPAPPASTSMAGEKKILVVDDNEDAADMLAEFLRIHGHEVKVAYEGSAALALLANFAPDVGILDVGLPGMDGFELARTIRALPARQGLRLIALTGYGQPGDRAATREAGFDLHLTKPVSLDSLLRLLDPGA